MWQVEVLITGLGRMIVGPFPDDQEDGARAVASAWYQISRAAKDNISLEDFSVDVTLKQYDPLLPNTDIDWLYSRYVKPHLGHGS